jgi:hypothetical protein
VSARTVQETNIRRKFRANRLDSLWKGVDGVTEHAATTPSDVLAGATLKPSTVTARLQALITAYDAATLAATARHSVLVTERPAEGPARSPLSLVPRALGAACG